MIIDKKDLSIEVHGEMNRAFFTVKEQNLAHIFSILRGSLYSNKLSAIIREYCTNAMDAHVEAGIGDTPINITLPSNFENLFIVRDFGHGLSESDIYNVFSSYGESTKRGTNSQVGMLGIGSKSAFCYVESFVIKSNNNGEAKTYNAYIDETGIGVVSKVHEAPTEETGLQIEIAIKRGDTWTFNNEIQNTLRFCNPTPSINKSGSKIDLEPYNFIVENDKWAVGNWIESRVAVLMGNIVYPVNLRACSLDDDLYNVFSSNSHEYKSLIIKANIGDVRPSASRESLEYDKQTCDFISKSLHLIHSEMKSEVNKAIANCNSVYDARRVFRTIDNAFKAFGIIPEYDGQKILTSIVQLGKINIPYKKECLDDGRWTTSSKQANIVARDETYIFVRYDNIPRSSARERADLYCVQNNIYRNDKIHIVYLKSLDDYIDFYNHPEIKGSNIIDLSDVYLPKVRKSRTSTISVKSSAYQYQYSYREINSSFWSPVEVDYVNDCKYYLPIVRFEPIGDIRNNHEIDRAKSHLKSLGLIVPNIYGIRKADVPKLGSGWINFNDYVKRASQSIIITNHNDIFNGLAVKDCLSDTEFELLKNIRLAKQSHIDFRNELFNCDRYPNKQVQEAVYHFAYNGVKAKSEQMREIKREIYEEYPIIQILSRCSYLTKDDVEIVNQFIQG